MRISGTHSPQNSDEAALIKRIRSGDETAMVDIYDRYSAIVYGVALRVLADTGAAEDVLQEVFLQLWRKPEAFDADRGKLPAWLAVIARNRAIDHLRRRPPEDEIADLPISSSVNLESEAAQRLAVEKIRKAVSQLSQEQRRTLEMAFFEGMTHTEIAAKTGEPLGTIKTRIRAGLIAVRKAVS